MSSQDAGGTLTADGGKDTGGRPPSAAFYEIRFVSGVEIAPRGEEPQGYVLICLLHLRVK